MWLVYVFAFPSPVSVSPSLFAMCMTAVRDMSFSTSDKSIIPRIKYRACRCLSYSCSVFLARLLSASLWVWGRSFKNSLGCKWWENGRRKFSWRGISGWENCWFRIWTGALLMNTFEIYQFLHHVRLSFKWAPKPLFIPLLFFFSKKTATTSSLAFLGPLVHLESTSFASFNGIGKQTHEGVL